MILAIDVSTSICGFTILNDGKIVLNTAIDFRNKKKFTSKYISADTVKEFLLSVKQSYDITSVYIEEPLQSFSSGFSSAGTLMVLSSFNGIISYLCYNVFGFEPQHIEPKTARKLCGIKIPKGEKAKIFCFEHNLKNEPDFEVEYTKQGNPKPSSYDRSDSIIIARAGERLENEKRKAVDSKGDLR